MTIAAQLLMGSGANHPLKETYRQQTSPNERIFSKILTQMQKGETKNSSRQVNKLAEKDLEKVNKQISELLLHGREDLSTEDVVKQITKKLEELHAWMNPLGTKTLLNDQQLQELQLFINEIMQKNDLQDIQSLLETNINNLIRPEKQVILNMQNKLSVSRNDIDTSIIANQTAKMIDKINTQRLNNSDYKQLLPLLAQWSSLTEKQHLVTNSLLSELASSKKMHFFQTLLTNFKNKENMQQKFGYANKVTQKEIQSWLMKAIEKDETLKTDSALAKNNLHSPVGQPMDSKIQQFIIHLHQTNNEGMQMQKQLMDQFQQILAKSNFVKLANGMNQLTIRLQPEYLGDIRVKLTQVNGEMIVKMLVQSQGAKELLEGNLTQLRHLFSPQQVTIEKMDSLQSSQPDTAPEENQGEADEGNAQSQDQPAEEHTEDETLNFHDLLMDAKV